MVPVSPIGVLLWPLWPYRTQQLDKPPGQHFSDFEKAEREAAARVRERKPRPGGFMRWLENCPREQVGSELERLRAQRPSKTIVDSYPTGTADASAEQLLKNGVVGIYEYTLATKIIRFWRQNWELMGLITFVLVPFVLIPFAIIVFALIFGPVMR